MSDPPSLAGRPAKHAAPRPARPRKTRIPLSAYVPERVARAARVAAFVATVALALVAFVGYRARAQISERLIDTGTSMLAYEGAHWQDARRTLLFNGQEIHFSSGMTRHSLTRVLDYYESHCLSHDGGVTSELETFIDAHPEVRLNTSMLDPILRSERGNRGTVACLHTDARGGIDGFMDRYARYRDSGDVSEIGDMRYLYAEQTDHGTHFVAFWTEGSFVLRDMLPDHGDAPGHDPVELGRPAGVRRMAQLREHGAPQRMTVFVADHDGGPTARALEAFYRADLEARGWRVLDGERARALGMASAPVGVVSALRGERMATLVFRDDEAGRGVVTILEAR